MKLYYSAGSCSTSCHISLEESGLKYEAIGIDWDNESDPNIAAITRLNPLGTLPVLVLDSGQVLDQNLAIHIYVADLAAERGLLPKAGTVDRAIAMNWLSFVAADLHKSFSPLFAVQSFSSDPKIQAEFRKWAETNVKNNLSYLDKHLSGKDYILGMNFSVADAYAFVVLGWCKWLDISIAPYSNIEEFMKRMSARPNVHKVLTTEGLL